MAVQTGKILYTIDRERCRSRLIEVGEIGEAVPALCGRDARAPRKSSSHDITFPPQGGSDPAVQTGNILLNREHGLHLAKVSRGGLATPQITPPLRGSRRDQGAARSRAGGGQTPHPVSDYQRQVQRSLGGESVALFRNALPLQDDAFLKPIEGVIRQGHEVTPRSRSCRSILVPLIVEGGPSIFVSLRVHSWFIFMNDRLFFSNDPHGRAGARLNTTLTS